MRVAPLFYPVKPRSKLRSVSLHVDHQRSRPLDNRHLQMGVSTFVNTAEVRLAACGELPWNQA